LFFTNSGTPHAELHTVMCEALARLPPAAFEAAAAALLAESSRSRVKSKAMAAYFASIYNAVVGACAQRERKLIEELEAEGYCLMPARMVGYFDALDHSDKYGLILSKCPLGDVVANLNTGEVYDLLARALGAASGGVATVFDMALNQLYCVAEHDGTAVSKQKHKGGCRSMSEQHKTASMSLIVRAFEALRRTCGAALGFVIVNHGEIGVSTVTVAFNKSVNRADHYRFLQPVAGVAAPAVTAYPTRGTDGPMQNSHVVSTYSRVLCQAGATPPSPAPTTNLISISIKAFTQTPFY